MQLVADSQQNEHPSWLQSFIDTYQQLGTDNLSELSGVYDKDVVFIDPMHHICGYDNLLSYFHQLYSNLDECIFRIDEVLYQKEQAAIYWTMQYRHPKLNKGKPVTVQGHSKIRGHEEKVIYHRDYLDLGAMLYEHIPLLGKAVKWIKGRAAS